MRPSLVVCSINGFGSFGPHADRPAFDFIAQVMSGFMSVSGGLDDPPMRSGLPISDLVADLYAALGIAVGAATRPGNRTRAADGDQPDQWTCQPSCLYRDELLCHRDRIRAQRQRSSNCRALWPGPTTRDGQIALAPADDVFFGRLADALGELGRKTHLLYAAQDVRVVNRARINAIIGGKLAAASTAYWVKVNVLNAAGVPCPDLEWFGCMAFRSTCRTRRAACSVRHQGRGRTPMIYWQNSATQHRIVSNGVRMRSLDIIDRKGH